MTATNNQHGNVDGSVSVDIDSVLARSECLYNRAQVETAIDDMANHITRDLQQLNPIVLCVMNGGLVATSELVLRLPFALQLDYLHCSRYRNTHTGSDELQWIARPQLSLAGRHLLIVDDILDEGLTLQAIIDYCRAQQAASVAVAVLVEKQHTRRLATVKADYCGLLVPDRYVFGFGMDSENYWRNLPGIYAFK